MRRSSLRAGVQRRPGHPCGSCGRRGGRSPSTEPSRGAVNILDALRDPALTREITLQPVRRLGVDAAILYSDIVAPVQAIGFGVEIKSGVGPVAAEPFRSAADLDRLRPLEPDADMPWQAEAIRLLVKELAVPLIGFAGAPFTVACTSSKAGRAASRRGHGRSCSPNRSSGPRLSTASPTSPSPASGARSRPVHRRCMLFDSWAGSLAPDTYRRHVLPATAKVFAGLADLDVPRIHFGVGTGELLGLLGSSGADVVGVDWRVPLDEAARRVPGMPLQGNLDPAYLQAPWPVLAGAADDVVRRGRAAPGHIFNLGHGVPPDTDPTVLERLVELVHTTSPA